ncbi:MAG: UDP-N-acetylglucosamine 2-epimerase (non-hydrolyzing) [Defluviitaleaceae bacterium]|nr:UDP-N-acetylglucosamine 2-epimerase (non-hydrolyzing) [Defluviitaleaceae bacterium]
MKHIKIMTIFGTRPEAIKMAPVIQALEKERNIQSIVTVTAQHRSQLDQVLQAFNITPNYDLNIMKTGQTLVDINTAILTNLTPILQQETPHMVLVHGDAGTSFAAALCAFYNQTPIGHVEAGLRSGDKYQPFPEEINRKLISHMADIHFAPTEDSRQNLLKENITKNIYVTGNTAIDAISITPNYVFQESILNQLDYTKKIITLTAHRRENLGENMHNICNAVVTLAANNPHIHFVYPVHQNPRVREVVQAILGSNPAVTLTEPINITDMHNLVSKSYLVLTDSGGLQEEAPHMNVPVIVLRNVTERPEGLATNVLKLAGTYQQTICDTVQNLLDNPHEHKAMAQGKNPFGDGKAAGRIVRGIGDYFDSSFGKV